MKIETVDKLPAHITRRGSRTSELSKYILDLPIDKVLKISEFDNLLQLTNQRQVFYNGKKSLKNRLRKEGIRLHTNIDKKNLTLFVSKSPLNGKEQ